MSMVSGLPLSVEAHSGPSKIEKCEPQLPPHYWPDAIGRGRALPIATCHYQVEPWCSAGASCFAAAPCQAGMGVCTCVSSASRPLKADSSTRFRELFPIASKSLLVFFAPGGASRPEGPFGPEEAFLALRGPSWRNQERTRIRKECVLSWRCHQDLGAYVQQRQTVCGVFTHETCQVHVTMALSHFP